MKITYNPLTIYLDSLDIQELDNAGEVVSSGVLIKKGERNFMEPSTFLTARIEIEQRDLEIVRETGYRDFGDYKIRLNNDDE